MIKVRISGTTINSGDHIDFPDKGVICILGGNNVGKSQLLREIERSCSNPDDLSWCVTKRVSVNKSHIDEAEALNYLKQNAKLIKSGQSGERYSPIDSDHSLTLSNFLSFMNDPTRMFSASDFFIKRYEAGNLGALAGQSLNSDVANRVSSSSFTGLLSPVYNDSGLEQEISDISQYAFGQSLTFDRLAFDLSFRVGKPRLQAPRMDQVSQEYVDEVTSLPKLDEQGDGVRSFLGLVVALLLGKQQVMLFDEPEAFLHPPQATALGRWIGEKSSKLDKQVFLSTHDRNILLGLLESGAALTLLRLTRKGNQNHLYQLDRDRAQRAWTDPVLRYSNVLQGLFHKQTVICEADADCRFYNAVLDSEADRLEQRACTDETLFIPAGGKTGVKALASVLSSLHVKVFVILDFDALNQKQNLKNIVEATGNVWTHDMELDYTTFTQWTNGKSGGQSGQHMWKSLKASGLTVVERGEPYQAAEQLIEKLKSVGVLIVPVGEMECLERGITGQKGDSWVREMLSSGKYKDNAEARSLIEPIIAEFCR